MADDKKSAVRKVVAKTIAEMNDQEKLEVLDWAERSLLVVNDGTLTRKDKVLALSKIKQTKPILRLLLALLSLIKNKTWTGQSWARRLGFITLSASAVAFGSKGAGIVAFGTAQAAPVLLLTTVGATFLGVVVDEINKERKR